MKRIRLILTGIASAFTLSIANGQDMNTDAKFNHPPIAPSIHEVALSADDEFIEGYNVFKRFLTSDAVLAEDVKLSSSRAYPKILRGSFISNSQYPGVLFRCVIWQTGDGAIGIFSDTVPIVTRD